MQLILLLNILSFLLFAYDKLMAVLGKWRIPEKMLLAFATCFGAAGALFSMCLFRHKTKVKKFTIAVPVMLLLQIIAIFFVSS